MRPRPFRALLLAIVAAATACRDTGPFAPDAAAIVLSVTTVQIDGLGDRRTILARVENAHGDSIASPVVRWTSSAPGIVAVCPNLTVVCTGALTTQNGSATVAAVGAGTATVTASAGSATTTLTVHVVQTPDAIEMLSGDAQVGATSEALATPLRARLLDRNGRGIGGQPLTFAVLRGGGSVGPATVTTDAQGIAQATWVLGPHAGQQLARVSHSELVASTLISATGRPAPGVPTSVSVWGGDRQAAVGGTAVPVPPSVVIRDVFGSPVAGVRIRFTVASGGGVVVGDDVLTNEFGVATAESWTLGAIPEPNTLTVTGPDIDSDDGVATINAVGCTGASSATPFTITLCYTTPVTTAQRQAFTQAAARWATVITDDVPDVPTVIAAGRCGATSPSLNLLVDDLVVFAGIESIDGAAGIVAQAGWCFVRAGSSLPSVGRVRLDAADAATIEAGGQLPSVVLHEMAHALGFGTSWETLNLLKNPVTSAGPTLDTHFAGSSAIAAFDALGGTGYAGAKVPVENRPTTGLGVFNLHWRPGVFGNELMTPFLSPTHPQPLSQVTARSLADLGYAVNAAAADPFTLPITLPSLRDERGAPRQLDLANDGIDLPRYSIDAAGRIVRIR
jgi:hypothetical protein